MFTANLKQWEISHFFCEESLEIMENFFSDAKSVLNMKIVAEKNPKQFYKVEELRIKLR